MRLVGYLKMNLIEIKGYVKLHKVTFQSPWGHVSYTRILNVLLFFFFFFNRHCNPCGLWPTHLSLSILSRKVFTECTSNLEFGGPMIRTFHLPPPGVPYVWNDASEPQQRKMEPWPRILPKVATSTSLLGSFTCRKFTTWDRRLYFPSEGRRAEDFFARKIPRLRPGLNPRTWVPGASTLAPRPPKPYFSTTNLNIVEMGNISKP